LCFFLPRAEKNTTHTEIWQNVHVHSDGISESTEKGGKKLFYSKQNFFSFSFFIAGNGEAATNSALNGAAAAARHEASGNVLVRLLLRAFSLLLSRCHMAIGKKTKAEPFDCR
jgi:hypothetical protein